MNLANLLAIRTAAPPVSVRKPKAPMLPEPASAPLVPATASLIPARRTVVPAVPARPASPTAMGTAPASFAALPEDARLKARERLAFVVEVRETASRQRLQLPEAARMVALRSADAYPLLSQAGKGKCMALTYNNYRRWSRQVPRAWAPAAEPAILERLADKYTRGARTPAGPPAFWKYLCAVYLNPHRLPATRAYDIAVKRLRLDDPRLMPPTFHQAKYYLDRIDRALVTLGRDGGVAFRNLVADYIERDWSAILPGELAVGDSRTFDSRVRVSDGKGGWIAVRPVVCALLDGASHYFAAWTVSAEAVSSGDIANCLAVWCCRWGRPPKRCYFDNGKDYNAKGFSTPLEVAGRGFSILQSLGVQLTNSIAYNGRAKIVERCFRDMMQGFDKAMPDYLGSTPLQRTMDAAYFDAHPEDLPSLQQFTEAFEKWLEEYHARPSKSVVLAGRSPEEVWEARPDLPPVPEDALREAFRRPLGLRTVGRGPSVFVGGRRYVADALPVQRHVLVKLDPVTDQEVHCYTPDGAFIATATARDAVPVLAESDEARDRLAAEMARQRRQAREARLALADLTGGLHLVSPYELLEAQPGSELRKLGSVGSVKGAEHHYVRHALALPGQEPPCRAAAVAPLLDAKPAKAARGAAEPPVDRELQRLISEARHDFQEEEPAQELPLEPLPQTETDPEPEPAEMNFRAALATQEEDAF